ncbi:MAG: hypothetical protein CMJ25_27000 [Phycisphaerae bacterium]|nr:hypothetical protein [Phycisphaerae bacterium]|tara:strand:+ start:1231 stop:2457 length:1227 start_codon:yes stop_codon:yes gene_type:complete
MAKPNNGLITETNAQYYSGSQTFEAPIVNSTITTTFNTDLIFGNSDPTTPGYNLNNFRLYISPLGLPGTFVEYTSAYTVVDNVITLSVAPQSNEWFVVQLLSEYGGEYGDRDAFGDTVENNYGGYAYTTLEDVITNFMIGYVGAGKLIPSAKTTDVMFFAKRGLQEFSYDTLKSIRSQELTVSPNLGVVLPQDYVNYVNVSWIDNQGVKHIIYPTTLTTNPYETPSQDRQGIPIQDNAEENINTTSLTEERWAKNDLKEINDAQSNLTGMLLSDGLGYPGMYGDNYLGQRYGLQPETSQINGWFTINERTGKMSFSSDLAGRIIVLEYISDGLGYDADMKIPKLAEEALYAHISHAIIASRINQPEYVVQRLRRERSAKLRNAKIRLSNIKLNEFVQIARGKSKWIKY